MSFAFDTTIKTDLIQKGAYLSTKIASSLECSVEKVNFKIHIEAPEMDNLSFFFEEQEIAYYPSNTYHFGYAFKKNDEDIIIKMKYRKDEMGLFDIEERVFKVFINGNKHPGEFLTLGDAFDYLDIDLRK
ncbi:hypothetical protein [Bacillus thuringiensis]|uniref:hypothetical protein n=1 Tax=Bacillus thuringiensis TaxID=1428 RepID=UPI0021D67B25|nr:hypothetical protein [Bacillus thuringiensis]MCU7666947.1 hypothetical protein [Bacillus thuringiensis]